jgi:hypothetical protein
MSRFDKRIMAVGSIVTLFVVVASVGLAATVIIKTGVDIVRSAADWQDWSIAAYLMSLIILLWIKGGKEKAHDRK